MRLSACLLVVIGLCVWSPITAWSQETYWQTLNDRFEALFQKGQYAEALQAAQQALQAAQDTLGSDHPYMAHFLENLALLYEVQHRAAEAEPLYQRALAIREKALGPEHPNVAKSLNDLALLYQAQGQYAQAEPLYQRALSIEEKALGPEHPDVAVILNGLAALYQKQGRYAQAEPLYQRAIAIRQKALGPEHPDVAKSLNDMAALYQKQGQYAKAKPLYQRALAIQEKALGPEHPDVALALTGLAALYDAQGDYAEAKPRYQRALAIQEKALGPEHPDVALALTGLAVAYQAQGQYAEAEPRYQRALAIQEKALGPEHPDVALTLNNLALLCQEQGQYAQAEPLYQRALAIREKVLGPEHPDVAVTLTSLAGLYHAQGDYAQAEPLYQRALAIRKKALGPEHPAVAGTLNDLALLYKEQGHYTEAEPLYQRVLAIGEKALGPEHPYVALTLTNLGAVYEEQGDYTEAEPLYQRALAIQEKALGPEHPYVATSLTNLALLYQAQGQYAQAELRYQQAQAIIETALDPQHPQLALVLTNLALLYISLDRPGAALPLLERALRIDERTLESVFSLASERKKFAFLRLVDHRYELLLNLVAQKMPSNAAAVHTALQATLRWKGVVLDALTHERRVLTASPDPQVAALVHRRQDITFQLAATLPWAGLSNRAPAEYRGRRTALENEYERVDKELANRSGIYAALGRTRAVEVDRLASALPASSALVEYVVVHTANLQKGTMPTWGAYRYLAFVLPGGQEPRPLLLDLGEAQPIDDAVQELRQQMAEAPDDIEERGEALAEYRFRKEGERLYQQVLAPLQAVLGGRTVVYLASDSALNLVPFEVLVDAQGRYLVETYQFNYVSSGRDIPQFGSASAPSTGVVILADPDYGVAPAGGETRRPVAPGLHTTTVTQEPWTRLRGTQQEAAAVVQELTGEVAQLYQGVKATAAVVKELRSPRILHLATHGFFWDLQGPLPWRHDVHGAQALQTDASPPGLDEAAMAFANPLMRSGIVLAGANHLGHTLPEANGNDGILTALEIAGLSLWGTNLVVLSACETGVGDARRGEGVFGLRRAFQLAGAQTVVMSLWEVPDTSTVVLMTDFYHALHAGVGKARALHTAALAQLQRRRQQLGAAHPFYWGAFIAVGDPGKL